MFTAISNEVQLKTDGCQDLQKINKKKRGGGGNSFFIVKPLWFYLWSDITFLLRQTPYGGVNVLGMQLGSYQ